MSTSATAKAIQTTSSVVSALGLKAAGFRRQGNHLHRTVDGIIHVVNFQANRWGTATSGSFTVNLAVTSPFLYATWTGVPLPSNPASAVFPWASRLGYLMPVHRDYWWNVDGKTNVDHLSREAAGAILEFGLPLLDSLRGVEVVLAYLRAGNGWRELTKAQAPVLHAILAAEIGELGEARKLLNAAYADAGSSLFAGTVRQIADRLGVPVA